MVCGNVSCVCDSNDVYVNVICDKTLNVLTNLPQPCTWHAFESVNRIFHRRTPLLLLC